MGLPSIGFATRNNRHGWEWRSESPKIKSPTGPILLKVIEACELGQPYWDPAPDDENSNGVEPDFYDVTFDDKGGISRINVVNLRENKKAKHFPDNNIPHLHKVPKERSHEMRTSRLFPSQHNNHMIACKNSNNQRTHQLDMTC